MDQSRSLVWNVTCPDTFTPSYTALASWEDGSVANGAEVEKFEIFQSPPSLPLCPYHC